MTLCKLIPVIALVAVLTAPFSRAVDYPKGTGQQFAHTFPYSMVGQLVFSSGRDFYSGSGTVVRPNGIITAGHNLWDRRTGWSTDVEFRRGLYGSRVLSEQFASRVYVLAGYRQNVARWGADSLYGFATDTGAARFPKPVANGAYAGWSTDQTLLTGSAYNLVLGYGGEAPHDGDNLLAVEPPKSFSKTFSGFFENESIYIEQGMSGGPVFARDTDGELYVCGTIVSGAVEPVAGGIRIFNQAVANFIRRYLR